MTEKSLLGTVTQHLKDSIEVKTAFLANADQVVTVAEALINVIKNGGRIYAFGNGGSTCDAVQLCEELVARYKRERPGIPAQHLCDTSTITCWANDYSYSTVFARQVETYVTSKDAVIGFSTSRNSENAISGFEAANKIGAITVLFSGKDGGKAKSLAKFSFIAPAQHTARIQELHITLVHILCELIETELYPQAK